MVGHEQTDLSPRELAIELAAMKAEFNYNAGTGVAAADMAKPGIVSPGAVSGVALGWNISDGICCLVTAHCMLSNPNRYHWRRQIPMAAVNILSGTQLILTSLVKISLSLNLPIEPFSFAVATLCDLVNTVYQANRASSMCLEDEWLTAHIEELATLREQLQDLEVPEDKHDDDALYQQLTERTHSLEQAILARAVTYCNEDGISDKDRNIRIQFVKAFESQLGAPLMARINHYLPKVRVTETPDGKRSYNFKKSDYRSKKPFICPRAKRSIGVPGLEDLKRTSVEIQKSCEETADTMWKRNVPIKLLSCIGMVMMCIPILHIPGIIITSAVAAYYLYQNRERIYNACQWAGGKAAEWFQSQPAAEDKALLGVDESDASSYRTALTASSTSATAPCPDRSLAWVR